MENASLTKATVVDVIGPLPLDNTCLIMMSAGGKAFPIQCSLIEAQECAYRLAGTSDMPPYKVASDILKAAEITVCWTKLTKVNGAVYSQIMLQTPSGYKKMSFDDPTVAILMAMANDLSITMEADAVGSIIDSNQKYHAMKEQLKELWPLPQIDNTNDLRILSDFLDESMPDGSIFRLKSHA